MFSRTYRFIISHNIWRCFFAGSAMVLFGVATLAGQIWQGLPALQGQVWWAKTPPEFWDRLMPLAQFAAAGSLAYLALEIFRHSIHVDGLVRRFFGPTAEDRQGVVDSIEQLPLGEEDNNLQLIVLIRLYQLGELRAFWGRGQKIVDKKRYEEQVKKVSDSIKEIKGKAERLDWFWYGTGKQFLKNFHVGRDTVWVSVGLVLAVWIHILATLERIVPMRVPPIFLDWWAQLLIAAALLGWGVCLPLYYVFVGRKLLDEIGEIADLAGEQLAARKNEIRKRDQEEVRGALGNLERQLGDHQDPGQRGDDTSEGGAAAESA